LLDQDLYKVLQVDAEADPDVIAAAYHTLAAKLHPNKDLTGTHEVWLAGLKRAFATLSDPAARRAYDQRRGADLEPVGPGHPSARDQGNGHHRLASGPLTERVQAGQNGAHVESLTISFGRYTGWTLGALARHDPEYLRWLSRHSSGIRYRAAILSLLSLQEQERAHEHVPQHTGK
jgi:curved DNA-binding protein CbpA